MPKASKNSSLHAARNAKNDEFYTRYEDIQEEIRAYLDFDPDIFRDKTVLLPCDDPFHSNFTKFFAEQFQALGLKKLISTCICPSDLTHPSEEMRGRILTLCYDGGSLFRNLTYLTGSGDFRSEEITKIRDEADYIITNPPFSLFRQFLSWIFEARKNFLIIGNINAISYREVFPLIRNNSFWLGHRPLNRDMYFIIPDAYKQFVLANKKESSAYKIVHRVVMGRLASACWFTNLDHHRRHQWLSLNTMAENLSLNPSFTNLLRRTFNCTQYPVYDHYDALEVPRVAMIPSDYEGIMAVPITFLGHYNPDQFEIVNANDYRRDKSLIRKQHGLIKDKEASIGGVTRYVRICIKNKEPLICEK